MKTLQLDWSSAEVSDAKLTVGFSERTPKKWREAFARAVALLSHDTWEVSELKQGGVRISPVRLGEEERVRHFLESAVLEANATLVSEAELFDDDQSENGEAPAEPSADEELTARFRAFA
jgi:hypothetical protein